MSTETNLKRLNTVSNELGSLVEEIEIRIESIDELFCQYSNSSSMDEKSHNERVFESQFNSFILNSKALRDSIYDIRNSINGCKDQ